MRLQLTIIALHKFSCRYTSRRWQDSPVKFLEGRPEAGTNTYFKNTVAENDKDQPPECTPGDWKKYEYLH